jgi:UDPglucose 6-dehydrogenase
MIATEPVVNRAPDRLVDRKQNPRRIAVIGCGHVGLIVSAGLAKLGHAVTGVDRDPDLVNRLCAGDVPFFEEGLADLVDRGLSSGSLTFTTQYEWAVPGAEFIFLAVDTPGTLGGAADLKNIRSATRSIAGALNGTSPIIINKSTSPIGTGDTIEEILGEALLVRGRTPRIVSNPEFLTQGRAVHDFFHPDRTVIGAKSLEDAESVADLYAGLPGELLITDLRTAEMIKYVANSFLATKVSFINEVAGLCEQLAVEIDDVVKGVGLDPRIGPAFLRPGIGFGGSCLPKDVAALRYMGEVFGVATPILSAVQQVNVAQRTSAVRRLRARLGSLEGKRIAVWGLTFKGNTEDVRDSPSLDVVGLLLNEGATVKAYDPMRLTGLPERVERLLVNSPVEATSDADALAILTDWPQFADIPLERVRDSMRGRLIFDGRNLLARGEAERLGFSYLGVGRRATAMKRRRTDA